ncbi:hypothetical protein Lal_00011149 [Lupinus albus]|nr:hypothetical protein Lal_00011149 [Lupinus albus]
MGESLIQPCRVCEEGLRIVKHFKLGGRAVVQQVGCESPGLNLGTASKTTELEYGRGWWNFLCSGEMRRYRKEHQWRRRPPGLILTLSGEANAISRPPGEYGRKRWIGAFGNSDTGAAWLSSARVETAGDKPEEGGDDVKSSWPLRPGLHTCYNGRYKGLPNREVELIP